MLLASIGEQASTALFFASTSTLIFCHLRAASILKKTFSEHRANKKQFAKNEKAKAIDEVIEN